MPELLKRDDALWLRHLRAAGIDVTLGETVRLRINGFEVDFEPMRPDRHGRKTHGLKATGRNAHQWHAVQRGATVFVELCGLEGYEPVVDVGGHVRRDYSLDATLPPRHDVSGRRSPRGQLLSPLQLPDDTQARRHELVGQPALAPLQPPLAERLYVGRP